MVCNTHSIDSIVSFCFQTYTRRQHDVDIYIVSAVPAGFTGILLLHRPGPWTQSLHQQP